MTGIVEGWTDSGCHFCSTMSMKWSSGSVGSDTTAPPAEPFIPNKERISGCAFSRLLTKRYRGAQLPHSQHGVAYANAAKFYSGGSIRRNVHVAPPIRWNRYWLRSLPSEAERQRMADCECKRICLLVAGVVPNLNTARGFPFRLSAQCWLRLRGRTFSPSASMFVFRAVWSLMDSDAIKSSLLPAFIGRRCKRTLSAEWRRCPNLPL